LKSPILACPHFVGEGKAGLFACPGPER
jgi:hypothetical protein